jgi:hypothetical protein
MSHNVELTTTLKEMSLELNHTRGREKKLMFFAYLLQNKGYPVNEIFENEVKNIPT